jgi:8-oxo-dGTP diphosphatase
LHSHGKLQYIATNRIAHFNRGARALQFPGVARTAEVIEHRSAIHGRQYGNPRRASQLALEWLAMQARQPSSANRIVVVAALIQRAGKLLVCQRRSGDSFGLKWEFPGGKVHDGEGPADALTRELREELGVDPLVGAEVYRTRHLYPQQSVEIELLFFAASVPHTAVFQNLAFETMEWAVLTDLPNYEFLPADRELVGLLASGKLQIPGQATSFP